MSFFSRNPLDDSAAQMVSVSLQDSLVAMIDLALVGKQAHWSVVGQQFLSVHLKLDDVVALALNGGERFATG